MKSKIFSIILATVSAFAFTFGLSACGGHKHELGELQVVERATCETAGEGVRICKICGEEVSEVIAPLGHDLQTISGKEPTCIDEGFTEYEVCLRVGCDYNTKRIIPATGVHVYDEDGFCIYCKREKTKLYFETSEDGTYAIFTGVDGWDEDEFVIPSDYNGVPVTAIGSYVLRDSNITSVIIPDSVITIGDYAFSGSAVTQVTIPDSVISIGIFAFESTLITDIVIPDSVIEIGDEAFGSCDNLTTVILSNNIQELGGVFNHCENIIYNRDEADSGNYLGSKDNPLLVLINADADVESFDIDANTKLIYGGAFTGCTKLKEIEIPDTVIFIGDSIFASIYKDGFEFLSCESLESVTLPSNLDKIPAGMFIDCSNLTEIKYFDVVTQQAKDGLPEGLKEIGDSAFAYSGIESIIIPSSVTTVGASAFEGGSLKKVEFYNNNSYMSIGSNAFAYCFQLENIVLPEHLTEIAYSTFTFCENLEWVYIPAAVQAIGFEAFNGCNNLKYVYYGGTTEASWNEVTLGQFVWGDKNISTIVYLLYSAPEYVRGGRYWWWNGTYPAEWLG